MKKLWYKTPASVFEEALPIGNGRLGGMYYGGVSSDKISLNEDTLWSGFPRDKSAKDPYNGICEAERLLAGGDIGQAEKVIIDKVLGEWTDSYQPVGNLIINRVGAAEYSEYYRELDLKNAVASSEFSTLRNKCLREVFCSAADSVMVYCFKNQSTSERLEILLESPHPYRLTYENGIYLMRSIAPSYAAPIYYDCPEPIKYDDFENNRALSYCVGVKPIALNGTISFENGRLYIDSSEFYLIIDAETNFDGFNVQPIESRVDEVAVCKERVERASQRKFEELKKRHISDYTSLFDRVEFKIDGVCRSELPTDERIRAYEKDNSDVGLAVLIYNYARYLTIASSRENTQATNLQGIWNEHIRAAWSSNYTLNINTEMNYWHVEKSNLSECHIPLIRLISELAQNGAKTAKDYYRLGGWCSHHNSDIWRQTDPVGRDSQDFQVHYAFWNMSGCWLACHIWNHFEYSGDIEFLRENFDTLKGAAEFLLGWLVEDENGQFVTPITTSPENRYILDGEEHALSVGCAMDYAISSDIFDCCIKAAAVLGYSDEFTDKLQAVLTGLKPYALDEDGFLLEWNKPLFEQDPHHRHISSLYGLYPGNTINAATLRLREAAAKVLERRGYEASGWALGWRMCTGSRLGHGEEAKKFLDNMLRPADTCDTRYDGGGGVYPNLLAAHPPFQIDANFAFAAGINEMLLQYENGEIKAIPAIPADWSAGGSIRGLKIPGNRTVNIEWKDGKAEVFDVTDGGQKLFICKSDFMTA